MKYLLAFAVLASLGFASASPAAAQYKKKKRVAVRTAVVVMAPSKRALRGNFAPSRIAFPGYQNDYVGSVPRGWFRQPSGEPRDYKVGSTGWWRAMDAQGRGGLYGG